MCFCQLSNFDLLKKLCSVLLIQSLYWTFEVNFGLSDFYIIVILKCIFLQHLVKIFLGLRFGRSSFLIIIIFSYILHLVNWPQVFKFSILNCYNLYQMALDHFRGHIWIATPCLLHYLTSRKLEGPKISQTTHPPVYPSG